MSSFGFRVPLRLRDFVADELRFQQPASFLSFPAFSHFGFPLFANLRLRYYSTKL
jgi:hypothetical protein